MKSEQIHFIMFENGQGKLDVFIAESKSGLCEKAEKNDLLPTDILSAGVWNQKTDKMDRTHPYFLADNFVKRLIKTKLPIQFPPMFVKIVSFFKGKEKSA